MEFCDVLSKPYGVPALFTLKKFDCDSAHLRSHISSTIAQKFKLISSMVFETNRWQTASLKMKIKVSKVTRDVIKIGKMYLEFVWISIMISSLEISRQSIDAYLRYRCHRNCQKKMFPGVRLSRVFPSFEFVMFIRLMNLHFSIRLSSVSSQWMSTRNLQISIVMNYCFNGKRFIIM